MLLPSGTIIIKYWIRSFLKVSPTISISTYFWNSEIGDLLGDDYMILVGQNEILFLSAEIPAVLQILHKLYLAITCKKFHHDKVGSLFCTAGIPFCPGKIFQCNCFSLSKWNKKIN